MKVVQLGMWNDSSNIRIARELKYHIVEIIPFCPRLYFWSRYVPSRWTER